MIPPPLSAYILWMAAKSQLLIHLLKKDTGEKIGNLFTWIYLP